MTAVPPELAHLMQQSMHQQLPDHYSQQQSGGQHQNSPYHHNMTPNSGIPPNHHETDPNDSSNVHDSSRDFLYQEHTPSGTSSASPGIGGQMKWKMDIEKLHSTIDFVLDMARSDDPHNDIFVLPPRTREALNRVAPMPPPEAPRQYIQRQPPSPRQQQQQLQNSNALQQTAVPQQYTNMYNMAMHQQGMQQARPAPAHTQQHVQPQQYVTAQQGQQMANYFVDQSIPNNQRQQMLAQQQPQQQQQQFQSNPQFSNFQPVFVQQPGQQQQTAADPSSIPQQQLFLFGFNPSNM